MIVEIWFEIYGSVLSLGPIIYDPMLMVYVSIYPISDMLSHSFITSPKAECR